MSLRDFNIVQRLGEGAYSSVYKAKRISDGEYYGLKKVKIHDLKEREKENALNEVRILASITHENIVGYKEAFIEDSCLYIVMEFCEKGNLLDKVRRYQKMRQHIEEKTVWEYAIQMTCALKMLHGMNILHRDLKCANVFLTKSDDIKVGDFNVSKQAKRGLLYTQTGTPYYASPEVWRDQPYDMKSDIWSLGCVLYELCTYSPPFVASDMSKLYRKIQRGIFPPIPTYYSADLSNFIKSLLQLRPTLRPNTSEILDMPSVKKRISKLEAASPKRTELMKTIRLSRDLNVLSERLPAPNYTEGSEPEGIRCKRSQSMNPEQGSLPNLSSNLHSKRSQSILRPRSRSIRNDDIQLQIIDQSFERKLPVLSHNSNSNRPHRASSKGKRVDISYSNKENVPTEGASGDDLNDYYKKVELAQRGIDVNRQVRHLNDKYHRRMEAGAGLPLSREGRNASRGRERERSREDDRYRVNAIYRRYHLRQSRRMF